MNIWMGVLFVIGCFCFGAAIGIMLALALLPKKPACRSIEDPLQ